jgi:hypothetical protein
MAAFQSSSDGGWGSCCYSEEIVSSAGGHEFLRLGVDVGECRIILRGGDLLAYEVLALGVVPVLGFTAQSL